MLVRAWRSSDMKIPHSHNVQDHQLIDDLKAE